MEVNLKSACGREKMAVSVCAINLFGTIPLNKIY